MHQSPQTDNVTVDRAAVASRVPAPSSQQLASSKQVQKIPTFIYIGTSKAGSTWLCDVLHHHPQVFMAPGKGLYFFCNHYHYGVDWYLQKFSDAAGEPVIGEISHSYLSAPDACERIAALNPRMRLMACLREPAERAFSAYLDCVKNGEFAGSFEQALEAVPTLIERGRYAHHLEPYLRTFGRENVHIVLFDELAEDPNRFANRLFRFLDIQPLNLPPKLCQQMMPAGAPRSRTVCGLAKRASRVVIALGMKEFRGRLKRSRRIRNLLYQKYTPQNRPQMQPQTRAMLRGRFRDEVHALDALLSDTSFCQYWNYA